MARQLKYNQVWENAIKRALDQPHWRRAMPNMPIHDLTTDILHEVETVLQANLFEFDLQRLRDLGEEKA